MIMIDSGYIRLHRGLNEWGWKKDHKTLALWIHLLLNANWKDGHYMGHKLRAGDIVIGRKALSYETGLSEREIRTSIEKLKTTGEVTSQATNRFTILTIVKWKEYQIEREQATSYQSNNRPTSDQQATTNEEGNKARIEKDISNDISKKTVSRGTRLPDDWIMTDDLKQMALQKGLTETQAKYEAEKFKDYWLANGKSYKDWNAVWRKWVTRSIEFRYPNGIPQPKTQRIVL